MVTGRVLALTSALLPVVLLLTGVAPESSPAPPADHVYALAGTWSCRTLLGAISTEVGTRNGNVIDAVNAVQPAAGGDYVLHDRFTYDDTTHLWHVEAGYGSPLATDGFAPPWTDAFWHVLARQNGVATMITYELLPDGSLRRSFALETSPGSDRWVPYSAELCASGPQPPPRDACIAENAPPALISPVPPMLSLVQPGAPSGRVLVKVELDAGSRVAGASISSSPSVLLNMAALTAARASRFRTRIVNCQPVAGTYLFTVDFAFGS